MAPAVRAGALALAGLTGLVTTSISVAGPPTHDTRPDAPSTRVAALAPMERLGRGAPLTEASPVASARLAELDRSVVRLRKRQRRAAMRRPRHPVRGSFRYGSSSARFGAGRSGHTHEGQDVFAPAGTPLVAVRHGVVVETGNDGGRGNFLALYSRAVDRTYVYLHLERPPRVGMGRRVKAGQRIGEVGCTGSCSGDHLHFEIRAGRGANGAPQDPLPQVRRWAAGVL
jgi:murein DD-endopeptidase MepM/ murein hydrolase activator NlpD